MCLIALRREAGRIVIAANRDEAFARPTRPAHLWEGAPHVAGGRDLMKGGSWLAVTAGGRFAAVTNLRGGPEEGEVSRGQLVRQFVLGNQAPVVYARNVAGLRSGEYAGFHLICGAAGDDIVHYSNGGGAPRIIDDEVFAASNGPLADEWPKMARARAFLRQPRSAGELMAFLATRDDDVFVVSALYGTRSSTVIFAGPDRSELFEQNFGPGGVVEGEQIHLQVGPSQP